jgi:bacterioferritin (cytochrome b1)
MTRNYKHEYQIRAKRQKRLAADLDKQTADSLLRHLMAKNETYISWLKKQIEIELKKA